MIYLEDQVTFQVMKQRTCSFKKRKQRSKRCCWNIKKSYEHNQQPVNVLYEAIKEYIEDNAGIKAVSLRAVTQILGVSRSGFKSWLNRKPSKSKKRKESVKKEISEIHEESHEIYGAPKITEELKKKGHVISEKTVGNYVSGL